MKTKENSLKAITDQGILPLFYFEDAQVSLEIIRTLYKAGIRVLEYTNRGPAALSNFKILIEALKTEMQDLYLGIGTIKTVVEAKEFIAAGAHFIVSPIVSEEVGQLVHEQGMLWVPGCFTPTEINTAHQMGAGLIKLFPANILGTSYMAAIRDLFPGQLFIPTGGVEIEQSNISNWFKSGVCAVGMGSKLISKDILENKDYNELANLTRKTIELVKSGR
ncbi:bifunctional 4-hydroxy-2-oxoglutarate aldolase/2-dehydro-3-deoxy-phosphogluconate aldolase [Pedobacter sp. N36a]|uniref:bifunctional 4-hydroxy-2-oxoglutarate aldolase/2-dehydro-3-deoxy-phosphogluconate aldolase n=1 Tax=Pedobacter sp. N36a TaxID=2767996 RepID=UPI001656FA9F|nr:bifunctional 4-hydroxy-2-oxoglutarate aldolase/2-dehydro-3-deoxy-phosphogluconate aldolase [Pedobacter sp. N36a]MBC8985129.1 bifunctional 4-hydroxy-2-oxoglutarate aldolase/2-dehydro-3-deoxy-phosphogluconate aldolase [Pedobacter sp. N36a]